MPSQVLRWCSAPPSCLLPLRNLIVRAAEEEEQQQQEVEVWAQGAACHLYTAWFSHRTNCTHLSPTRPLGSPFAPKSELTSWSAKCFLMSAWPPAEQKMVGAFGTGWEGGAVGRPRLRPAKLPKVPVVRVLKVCATAEALGGIVMVIQLDWICSVLIWNPCYVSACVWWSYCWCLPNVFAVHITTCSYTICICVQSNSISYVEKIHHGQALLTVTSQELLNKAFLVK